MQGHDDFEPDDEARDDEDPETGDDQAGWVHLITLASEEEAWLLQGRLESEGIPCSVESLKYHAEPVNFGRLSEVRVHVLNQHLARSRELLRELREPRDSGE